MFSRPSAPRGGTARRRITAFLTLAILITSTAISAPTTTAATLVIDPDRNSAALTGWAWQNDATPAQISAALAGGARIVDLEVNSTSPTFSVAYVQNSGTYGRGWWWYYNLTAAELGATLTANNARPIDIEPYNTASGLRFAVVMVSNTGVAAKGWWWFYNQTAASISSFASANNARVVDLDRYGTGAGDRFNVILIPNTGVDGSAWWMYYNLSASAVGSTLSANNARLIDIERTPTGGYDVVMVPAVGIASWWYHSQSVGSLNAMASQLGARISKIEPYLVSGTRYFAALLVNNVDAETARIRNLAWNGMLPSWGFYVKKVGGDDVVGLQPDRIFEPASMLKILHAVTALREVQTREANTDVSFLEMPITWYAHPDDPARTKSDPDYDTPDSGGDEPDKMVCAYDGSGDPETDVAYTDPLGSVIIRQTLMSSDNRTTDALTNRYGFVQLNETAALAKMTRTHLYHRIGCDEDASPQPYHANELTLRDAGRIYEGIHDGTLLDTNYRDWLYSNMPGGAPKADTPLGAMITKEADAAGLTADETKAFLEQTYTVVKGGSYHDCSWLGGCDVKSTAGGMVNVPFKTGAVAYVYGRFYNVHVDCSWDEITDKDCTRYNTMTGAYNDVAVEMFRKVIKEAVATW
jgi:hypothetical protein